MITISPGHWRIGSGASDLIDEVTEARKVAKKVTEILRRNSIITNYLEDDQSSTQAQNVNYLVIQHNKTSRKLDVSIHFNASSRTNKGLGVEVLYYDQRDLAAKVSKTISDVSGLKDRGAKERKELAFLKATNKPALLIEVCFVSDTVDVSLYLNNFEKICYAIAKELASFVGKTIQEGEEMKFSSNSLKSETEITLNSKARREIIVNEAIKAGAHESWKWKLEAGTITDADLLGLAAKAIIDTNK